MNHTRSKLTTQPTSGHPIFYDLEQLDALELPEPEYVIYGLPRTAIGMLQSVTNVGKTTLMLNICLSLACGRPYGAIVSEGEPRRIMYIDMETPIEDTREDLHTMRKMLTPEQDAIARKNFRIYNMMSQDGDALRLDDPGERNRILQKVIEFKPDLIVVDTLSLAFPTVDENSNSGANNFIIGPLKEMARRGNSAVLLCHHIGKEKSEEGKARDEVLRARGASALPSGCRAVYQLERRTNNGEIEIWFSVEKVKGDKPAPVQLELDNDLRWFSIVGGGEDESLRELVAVFPTDGSEIKRNEIESKMIVAPATLTRMIRRGLDQGLIEKGSYGKYKLRT